MVVFGPDGVYVTLHHTPLPEKAQAASHSTVKLHAHAHLSLKECSCRCRNIMDADSSTAVGLAMPLPAMALLTCRAPCRQAGHGRQGSQARWSRVDETQRLALWRAQRATPAEQAAHTWH